MPHSGEQCRRTGRLINTPSTEHHYRGPPRKVTLMVNLTTADISDSAGAQMILDALRYRSSPRHGTGPPPLSATHSARASPSNF